MHEHSGNIMPAATMIKTFRIETKETTNSVKLFTLPFVTSLQTVRVCSA